NKLLETVDDLAKYRPPQGRTNLIPGIKHTYLIDDSYNSSPAAAKAALEVLDQFPVEGRKIAVFGKMLELGSYQEEGHREVGKKAAEVNLAMLVAVGEMSRDIIRGAVEAGLPEERTFYFDNNHQAGIFVQNKLKENDLILIKGSQGARMEQIVKELMAEPLKARDLLVRQSDKWLAT
ncbi:MAG TPA: cyanophycin synthetase, partial [Patescibacteria group bacterium]|nr:cyanophycin synthetase [Patescibacteria group bacterium]